MALVDLTVPDLGDFHDIPVIEVLVAPGDTVRKDEALVTLESDKATMEVPAIASGVVREISVKIGDRVSTGTVIARVESAAADEAKPAAAPVAEASAPPRPAAAVQTAVEAPPPAIAAVSGAPSRNGGHKSEPSRPVHASPAIRRFARELGVELSAVSGSGPNGRITHDDVQAFVKRTLTSGAVATQAAGTGLSIPPWPVVDFAKFGPVERVTMPRIRKLSGAYLHRNWVSIPHVTQHDDADVTDLETFRKQLNAEQKDAKVTLLAFVMKACVAALQCYPEFNASLDGDDLVLKRYYHIGFAADTPGGLVVPVVRDVDRKGILDIARETSELAAKGRDGKLSPAEMSGGTFTISSLGGIGGTAFTPIINAPEVAILGLSKTATRPVWDGTAFAPRLLLPLSLSYDHRVIDGAAAARFTSLLAGLLADMRRTLL